MKSFVYIVIILFFSFSTLFSQEVKKIGSEELKAILNSPSEQLHVINFWATWCGPCVVEIPHFENVAKKYPSDKVKFILVSLDFPSQLEKRLIPFIEKHKISLNVILIEELDYDKWMRDVDPNWQGNIPATLFFNNPKGTRHFISNPLDEKDLKNIIEKML